MLTLIHQLLDEADAVITYNGKKFDIPVLNKEFVSLGMSPPAPYKHIDLYQVVRKNFRFASNKLDYICQSLGLGNKIKHRGMDLWKDCIDGDEEAIEEMLRYNQQDVVLLEKLYYVLLPWFKSPINHAIMQGELVCTNCGSKHYHSRGHAYTSAGKYARYQCQDCGTWFRSNKTEAHKDKFIGV
jgi:DNA polymerase elongation subunit (family B)